MHVLRVHQHNRGQETSPGRRREVGGYPLGKEYLRSLATLLQWYIKSNGLRMGIGSSFCIRSHTPKYGEGAPVERTGGGLSATGLNKARL